MEPVSERELMRLLVGELPAERASLLRRRIAGEPALAGRYARLQERWQGLELPPPAPAPPGFATRVVAAARRQAAGEELRWSLAPRWARAAAVAALTAGVALGALLGAAPRQAESVDSYAAEAPLSLAESYWMALADDGGTLLAGPEGTP